jgi:hypothetical protein
MHETSVSLVSPYSNQKLQLPLLILPKNSTKYDFLHSPLRGVFRHSSNCCRIIVALPTQHTALQVLTNPVLTLNHDLT